jgi:hypothetical protein
MYTGKTYQIPCTGSWNGNDNYDEVPQESMVDVDNVNVHNGGRQPRGGCEELNSTPITDSPDIMGIYQFIREDGSLNGDTWVDDSAETWVDNLGNEWGTNKAALIKATSDGKVYRDYTTELKSGLTNFRYTFFETFYDQLFISNGVDTPQVWQSGVDTWDIGTPETACVAALAGDGAGNVDDGVHYYKVTYVTSSGESSGNKASNALTVADQGTDGKVDLTAIPTGPSGTTSRKLYRTEAGGSTYKLLDTIADNTTTTYEDDTADAGLGAEIPLTNLAFCPSDWIDNPPKYFIKHGRGVNKRLWAFGCSTTPNVLYVSTSGQADFGDDNVTTIRLMVSAIVSAFEFGEYLFVCDNLGQTYLINDEALTVANWGYYALPFKGAAASQNLWVKTPTDVMVMSDDGNLASVRATQQYGDFELASVVRPVFLHKWIEDNVDLTQYEKFHMRYDPDLRMVKIFVVLNGETLPTCGLCYQIDRGLWTKHTFDINFVSSAVVRTSVPVWKIFTGDDGGTLYALEYETLEDAGVAYDSNFKTPPLAFGNSRMKKRYDKIWLVMKPKGTETMHLEVSVDDRTLTTDYTITTAGAENILKNYGVPLGVTGSRIQIDVSNEDGDDYFISQILADVTELGQGA